LMSWATLSMASACSGLCGPSPNDASFEKKAVEQIFCKTVQGGLRIGQTHVKPPCLDVIDAGQAGGPADRSAV
jgi:hypothetical protein